MAENLPEPKSRKESYLAKAAGMDVTVPEAPESREEQYLAAIAEGGGGGTSDFNDLTNRPKYNGSAMTGDTNIPSAPTVVQTTGTSTTDVMSQNAVTSMVFADPSTMQKIKIGSGTYANPGTNSIEIGRDARAQSSSGIAIGDNTMLLNSSSRAPIAIGSGASAYGDYAISIGQGTSSSGTRGIAIGSSANATQNGAIALGYGATTSSIGEMNIGSSSTSYGYNSTNYRLLSGLYDAQSAHDAVTLGQLNTRLGNLTITTISQTDYNNLQTKDPNTLYLITGA